MKAETLTEITFNYKMTELGLLPKEWEVVSIIDICNFERGTEPGSKTYNREGKGIPFIRVSNISSQVNELVYTTSQNVKLCKEDDILISLDGTVGVVARGIKGAYSSGIRKVVTKVENLEKEFIFYILQTTYVQKIINKFVTGVTIKHASNALPNIKIPLPPLSEQRKIAAILSTVQKAIEIEKQLIERTKELKKSMMHKLFTEGLYGEKQKMTEIGLIPESWEVVKLGDYLLKNNNFRLSTDNVNIETACFIPMSLIPEEGLFISQFEKRKISEIRSGIIVYENDLLVAKITPSFENGKQGIVKGLINGWGYATTEVIPIRVNGKTDIKYIAYYLKYSKVRNLLAGKMEGSTGRQRLPKSQIENLSIPLPSLSEQQEIANILSTIDQKIQHHTTKKQKLEELFRNLLHNLMTAKVRVKEVDLGFLKKEKP